MIDHQRIEFTDLPEDIVLARCRPTIARAAASLLRGTSSYLELEDFVQTGSLALLAALRTLPPRDPKRSNLRYVWERVLDALLHEIRATSAEARGARRREARLRRPFAATTPEASTLGGEDQETAFLAGQLWSLAQRAIEHLSRQERAALLLYYFRGATLREVGTALGVTESRASQVHKNAILCLRGRLRRFSDQTQIRA